MTVVLNAKSTADDVLQGVSLEGRRVFITGVSSGIGLVTALAMAARGAHVIGTARDIEKNREQLAQAGQGSGGAVEVVYMDLADLASVRKVAAAMLNKGAPFDAVIANAGVMNTPFGHTKDGFETQFGTNFIGHFVLANQLAPLMLEGARLVVLSSAAHRFADVDLDDPGFEHTPYDPSIAYGRSKTADSLLAVAFDERHRSRRVRAIAVHPGNIWTDLARHVDMETFSEVFEGMKARHIELGNEPFELKSPEQGAATSLWAAFVADADKVGATYCEDCGISPILTGDRDVSIFAPGVMPYALDPERARALWAKADEMLARIAEPSI